VRDRFSVPNRDSGTPEPRVERIEFRISVGRCGRCGRRVQGRHPRQTSDAIGSARHAQGQISEHGVAVTPGKIGSSIGSNLTTALSLTAESPLGQPSAAGASFPIHLPELSGSGSHEPAS
jgi:hypothetical protein